MKHLVIILSIALGFMINAYGQNQPAQNPTGVAAGINWPGQFAPNLQAGRYDFVQFNKSEVEKFLAQEIFQRNAKDREFFLNEKAKIEGAFRKLLQQQTTEEGGMVWLSNQTQGGTLKIYVFDPAMDPTTLQAKPGMTLGQTVTYSGAITRFNAAVMQLRAQVNALNTIAGAFPSQQNIKTDQGENQEIPNYNQINFAAFVSYYNSAIDGLVKYVSDLRYVRYYTDTDMDVVDTNSGKGLSINADKWHFDLKALQAMLDRIQELRSGTMQAEDAAKAFTDFLVNDLVLNYLSTYGFSEKWRSQNDVQRAERTDWAKNIAKTFFYRSYLRKKYRMALGLRGIDYRKLSFNLDVVFNRTRDLFNFDKEVSFQLSQAPRITQNYRMIVKELARRTKRLTAAGQAVQDAEVKDVQAGLETDFSEMAVADTPANLPAKGVSLLTWIGGNTPLADVGLMMMRLFAHDAYEEVLVWEGRYEELEAGYLNQYFNTDEDDAYYTKLETQAQNLIDGNEIAQEGTPGYYLRNCSMRFADNEANLDTAKHLWEQYQILRNLGNSDANKRREAREKALEDEKEKRRQQRQQNQGK